MKKSIKLLTIGMILTLCAGFASCGGGSSSSSSSSSTPSGSTSTSTSTSSSTPEITVLEPPEIIDFYSNVNITQEGGVTKKDIEYVLEWHYTKNAQGYLVTIDGTPYETNDASFDLYDYTEGGKEYEVTVTAKGDGVKYLDSEPTTKVVFRKHVTSGLGYSYRSVYNTEDSPECVYVPDRVDMNSIKDIRFINENVRTKCVWLPKSTEKIAFVENTSLEKIVFEEGCALKEIEYLYATAIERFEIPATVKTIADYAFAKSNIKEFTVHKDNPYYSSIDGNLYNKDGTRLIQYATAKTEEVFVVPEQVTTCSKYAFSNCSSLKTIVFCGKQKELLYLVVDECTALERVVLPSGLTKMLDFYGNCNLLTEIYYKGTVESWSKIEKNTRIEENLKTTTVYFYSEDEPEEEGNFWHYNSEGEIEVWE